MIALTLYSRPGCHLCEQMKATIDRVAQSIPLTLEVIDISDDADLDARYGLVIPVLLVDGRKAAKYRIEDAELTKILMARTGGPGRAGGPGK
jgi:glutaredoxin